MPEAAVLASPDESPDGALPPFTCSWHVHHLGAGWVQVTGELDLATSPQLQLTLREAQRALPLVVLDLRDLTFIDGSGVHVIVELAGEAKRDGGWLLVVRGPAQVERLLALTGLCEQVLIFDLNEPLPGPGAATRSFLQLTPIISTAD